MKFKECLSFDDLLLEPQYSEISSRKEIDLSSYLGSYKLKFPVIASPMDRIVGKKMMIAMSNYGGLAILHRYNTIEEQTNIIEEIYKEAPWVLIGAAIGVVGDYLERAKELVNNSVYILCVDIAHGSCKLLKEAIFNLRKALGDDIHLMAGNVSTADAFEKLALWGADSIRISVGSGSSCSTRIMTGHGIPTLQAIFDCEERRKNSSHFIKKVKIIADGGIRNSGDMCKCFAAGADFCMVGGILSGTDECPGPLIEKNGSKFKEFRGMSSFDSQMDWHGKSSTPEGISTIVPYKGPVKNILETLEGGIRSGLSYSGAINLQEFKKRAVFVRQTNAGQIESFPHILLNSKIF